MADRRILSQQGMYRGTSSIFPQGERSINSLTNSDISSNFFSLPREFSDRRYKPVLSHQELIDPWVHYDRR